MLLDLILAAVLILLAAFGAWRGAVAAAVGLLGLLAGYAGALFAATHLAAWAEHALVLPALAAPAVAGTLGFAVVWLVASALGDLALAWDAERIESTGRGPVDRMLGGALGFVRGGFVVVLLALLSSWLDAARDLHVVGGLAAMPDAEASAMVGASGRLVESVVAGALAEAGPAGQVAARITARPGATLASARTLLEDPRLTALFEDAFFWTLLTNGSVDYAMNQASMRAIVEDAALRGRFADLGLVEPAARQDPDRFRATMAGVLGEVAPKVNRLMHDEELNALAQDPQIVSLVEAGDVAALAAHPSVRQIVARISAR